MNQKEAGSGIVNFDFKRFFPFKFWVSNWTTDGDHPENICYKILSVKDCKKDVVNFTLVRSFQNNLKEELFSATMPIAQIDEGVGHFVNGLKKKLGLDFEEQDYSNAKTLEEFKATTKKFGWETSPPSETNSPRIP